MYRLPAFNVSLAYLRSMIASTLTDACICKLRLYILAGCGKQQTRNDRSTLHRYENRLPLSTENFRCKLSSVTWPIFESLLSKMYFRKKTFLSIMTLRRLRTHWPPAPYWLSQNMQTTENIVLQHEYSGSTQFDEPQLCIGSTITPFPYTSDDHYIEKTGKSWHTMKTTF